ncbi:MAG: hypothetical protein PHR35_11940 [Kiritimatiellae bacterium]|nr:hypothetical protein [Kiritimatiellia bacterium]
MTRNFDRLVCFDDRSRAFPIRTAGVARLPRTMQWACNAWLDQGSEGACVGFGLAHELAAEPAVCKVSARFARERIYWEAQRRDGFAGGDYPGAKPKVPGTSVLAGLSWGWHGLMI